MISGPPPSCEWRCPPFGGWRRELADPLLTMVASWRQPGPRLLDFLVAAGEAVVRAISLMIPGTGAK